MNDVPHGGETQSVDGTAMSMDPHRGQETLAEGVPLREASWAMVMLHGRGGSAQDILVLRRELDEVGGAFLAPQAAGRTWYPHSFLAPIEQNEPALSSALAMLSALLGQVQRGGVSAERTMLLGFSQGACLALEFAARHARRYGGIVGLSGGLIGPHGTPRHYRGTLADTPIFLGCSDIDPHIPLGRVNETEEVLVRLGGRVTKRIYPDFGHAVNRDEIRVVRTMITELRGAVSKGTSLESPNEESEE